MRPNAIQLPSTRPSWYQGVRSNDRRLRLGHQQVHPQLLVVVVLVLVRLVVVLVVSSQRLVWRLPPSHSLQHSHVRLAPSRAIDRASVGSDGMRGDGRNGRAVVSCSGTGLSELDIEHLEAPADWKETSIHVEGILCLRDLADRLNNITLRPIFELFLRYDASLSRATYKRARADTPLRSRRTATSMQTTSGTRPTSPCAVCAPSPSASSRSTATWCKSAFSSTLEARR